MLMKNNPMKLTTMLLLGLGAIGIGSWLTNGRIGPEAHAHLSVDSVPLAGDFTELNDLYKTLKAQGVPQSEVAAQVAIWVDTHE